MKRAISLFLALVMMVVMVPVSVVAETEGGYTYTVSDGKATITKAGSSIGSNVVIPETLGGYPVTGIGDNVFQYWTKLTSIVIPDSVTSIGSHAFYDCTNLKEVYITDLAAWCRISFDGSYSYPMCYGAYLYLNGEIVTELVIPDSVTSINHYAFACYDSLTSVVIPDSVKTIGISAFYNCTNLTNVTIPDSVTSIGSYAFQDCDSLISVTIPDSVTSISHYAFFHCDSLTSVIIPNSVTSIGDDVFQSCNNLIIYCNADSYARKYAINNGHNYDDLPTIEDFVIKDGVLTNYVGNGGDIVIPDSVTSIGNNAFSDCTILTSVTIPDSVTSIGRHAFTGCDSLTSITIGNGVTSIGWYAFSDCNSLTEVHISDIAAWCSIDFEPGDPSLASNPLYHGVNLYLNENLVTELVIPDGVERIGDYAFYNCKNITSVTIPDSVTSIGDQAFYNCTNLTEVYISDITAWCNTNFIGSYSGPLYYAKNLYLNGELVTDLVIPEDVTEIPKYAFYNCTNLTDLTIPETVTFIDSGAFSGCTNLTIHCYDNSHAYVYSLLNGIPFVILEHEFIIDNSGILTEYNGDGGDVMVPEGVTSIGASAFAFCSGIKTVTLPEGVTFIGTGAFSFCPGLEKVVLPKTLISIDTGAFAFCPALSDIDLPDGLLSVGNGAFSFCNSLTSLTAPASMSYLGEGAFEDCENLETVVITNDSTEIGDSAFSGCSALTLRCYDTSAAAGYAEENEINYRPILCGDVNDDGNVTASDSTLLSRQLTGSSESVEYGADYNRDGKISAADLTLLKRKLTGADV